MNEEVDEKSSDSKTRTNLPRLAFWGVGKVGKFRMDAIRESKLASVVSLCDPYSENTQQFCKDNNLKNIDSFEALLNEDIDGIVIATPNAMHKEQAICALEHGKAVFCQKPLANNAADAMEVIEAAKRNNCLLMTDLSYRHTKSLQKIKTLIDANELGQLYAVQLNCHIEYGHEKSELINLGSAGGGCLLDIGVNLVDILYWFFPFIELSNINSSLFVHGAPLTSPLTEKEDYAMSQLTFTNGLVSQLCSSWNSHTGKEAIIEFNFFGTKGGATFRNVNGSLIDFKGEYYKGTKRQVLSLPPDEWYGKSAVQWASLLANKNEYRHDIENYIKTATTIDGIYEASIANLLP